MFERPQRGELALLVHIYFKKYENEEIIKEFRELALAAGAHPTALITGRQYQPQAKYFIGVGKLEEIRTAGLAHQSQLILFNHDLSPAQERNLEQKLHCRVLGRTGLILDIFAQRARTFEGQLQVKLAQLEHLSTRLIRGWTHLERQRGGIGLRGPGETQLETDKRLIRQQIKTIKKRLEKVRRQRAQSQRARKKSKAPYISLVGYTNTGKSTLFNRLTQSNVLIANQPFATLDPSIRRMSLNGKIAILADTVGFIRHLPHHLIAAFRATLEETQHADLLLHVVDAANTEKKECTHAVDHVLKRIHTVPITQLIVVNKIDRLNDSSPRLERSATGLPTKVWISAQFALGIDLLKSAVIECLAYQTNQ
ncbi:ribosome rescue GTPase HflX [Rickettsiella grylli]|uniref:GTPase HflX n=1 Tax=Rickettsiella grylli TaxID=59196 RepID=A8PN68_9COXI|nr:ribosome rescue GTPase HflX [Rickettsiella grylli]EDP46280.1 GTP-binding proten HflX [Rickettsiella grylli]